MARCASHSWHNCVACIRISYGRNGHNELVQFPTDGGLLAMKDISTPNMTGMKRIQADDRQCLLHRRSLSREEEGGSGRSTVTPEFAVGARCAQISDDWTAIANVLDRLLLIFFSTINIAGQSFRRINSGSLARRNDPDHLENAGVLGRQRAAGDRRQRYAAHVWLVANDR